jgi:hypothetical protein
VVDGWRWCSFCGGCDGGVVDCVGGEGCDGCDAVCSGGEGVGFDDFCVDFCVCVCDCDKEGSTGTAGTAGTAGGDAEADPGRGSDWTGRAFGVGGIGGIWGTAGGGGMGGTSGAWMCGTAGMGGMASGLSWIERLRGEGRGDGPGDVRGAPLPGATP